jgi:serine/threonine-protein kinase
MSGIRLPRTLGRYTLFDFIGKGGMAEIYLARAKTELGATRHAVVKVILPELAERKEFADMLVAEAKLAAKLSHANVVQVLDLGREDNQLYIAMEYVEGFDLAALLRRCSREKVRLPIEYALHVVMEALAGLDHAHKQGIVHRDVSPSNVLVSFEGEVKVCDFGIARANTLAQGAALLADEAIKGKAGYMSPEQARGEEVDARSDVFAAGILLWELVQGRRMYRVADAENKNQALLQLARAADVPTLESRGLPNEEKLFDVVRRALEKDPADRFASASAMRRDLEGYVLEAKLGANAIKLGDWLRTTFGEDVLSHRRARERAIKALERGPAARIEPIGAPHISKRVEEEEGVPQSLVATAMDVAPGSKKSEATPPRSPATYLAVGVVVAAAIVITFFALR